MKKISLKTIMIGAFALIAAVSGIMTTTTKTYALTPISPVIMTISENLKNLIIKDMNQGRDTFPIVNQYCPYIVPGGFVQYTIQCNSSYYQKLALATHKTISKTIKSYEKRYPDIRQRVQRLKTAIDYAEMQRDATTNAKKKFVYDWIRLELYNYTSNLDDNNSDNICTILNDIFEEGDFCNEDTIIDDNGINSDFIPHKNSIYRGIYNNRKVLYTMNSNGYEFALDLSNDVYYNTDGTFGTNTNGYQQISTMEEIYRLNPEDDSRDAEQITSAKTDGKDIYITILKPSKNPSDHNDFTSIKKYNIAQKSLSDIMGSSKPGKLVIKELINNYLLLLDYPVYGGDWNGLPDYQIFNITTAKKVNLHMVGDIKINSNGETFKYRNYKDSSRSCNPNIEPIGCNDGRATEYVPYGSYITKKLP